MLQLNREVTNSYAHLSERSDGGYTPNSMVTAQHRVWEPASAQQQYVSFAQPQIQPVQYHPGFQYHAQPSAAPQQHYVMQYPPQQPHMQQPLHQSQLPPSPLQTSHQPVSMQRRQQYTQQSHGTSQQHTPPNPPQQQTMAQTPSAVPSTSSPVIASVSSSKSELPRSPPTYVQHMMDQPPNIRGGVDVVLTHRVRGRKGWVAVEPEDQIRVTKDRGKVFKLTVEAPALFQRSNLHLHLISLGEQPLPGSDLMLQKRPPSATAKCMDAGLTIVTASKIVTKSQPSGNRYHMELSLKINILCERLQLFACVEVPSEGASPQKPMRLMWGKTVEFMTHNNGKLTKKGSHGSDGSTNAVSAPLQFTDPLNVSVLSQQQQQLQQQLLQQHYVTGYTTHSPSIGGGLWQQQPQHIIKSDPYVHSLPGQNALAVPHSLSSPELKQSPSSVEEEEEPGISPGVDKLYTELLAEASAFADKTELQNGHHMREGVIRSEGFTESPDVFAGVKARLGMNANESLRNKRKRPNSGSADDESSDSDHANYIAAARPPIADTTSPSTSTASSTGSSPAMVAGFEFDDWNDLAIDPHSIEAGAYMEEFDLEADIPSADEYSVYENSHRPDASPDETKSNTSSEEDELTASSYITCDGGRSDAAKPINGTTPRLSAPQVRIAHSPSNVRIGKTATQLIDGHLDVDGIVRARGFMQFSDIRLKTDVEDIVNAIDLISRLEGKSYRWKPNSPFSRVLSDDPMDFTDGESIDSFPMQTFDEAFDPYDEEESFGPLDESAQKSGERVIGLIAQEVQKVIPEVVKEDKETGYLSVAYAEIVPVLINAFNDHMRAYSTEQNYLMQRFSSFERDLASVQTGPHELSDKEQLAKLALEMKGMLPSTPYSRLVNRLRRQRRRDKIVQRNCILLLLVILCLVCTANIIIAVLSPISYTNILETVTQNVANDIPTPTPGPPVGLQRDFNMQIVGNEWMLQGLRIDSAMPPDIVGDTLTFIANGIISGEDPLKVDLVHDLLLAGQVQRRPRSALTAGKRNAQLVTKLELKFSTQLISVFQYRETNGKLGFQEGEPIEYLLEDGTVEWTLFSNGTYQNGDATLLCFESFDVYGGMVTVGGCTSTLEIGSESPNALLLNFQISNSTVANMFQPHPGRTLGNMYFGVTLEVGVPSGATANFERSTGRIVVTPSNEIIASPDDTTDTPTPQPDTPKPTPQPTPTPEFNATDPATPTPTPTPAPNPAPNSTPNERVLVVTDLNSTFTPTPTPNDTNANTITPTLTPTLTPTPTPTPTPTVDTGPFIPVKTPTPTPAVSPERGNPIPSDDDDDDGPSDVRSRGVISWAPLSADGTQRVICSWNPDTNRATYSIVPLFGAVQNAFGGLSINVEYM